MPRTMPCPHCAKLVGIPDGDVGLLRCPHCSSAFDAIPTATPLTLPKKIHWLVWASVAALLLLIVGAFAVIKMKPDKSFWYISQPGMTGMYTAKGRPSVSGSSCTFVDNNSGQTITITGRFEIRSAD